MKKLFLISFSLIILISCHHNNLVINAGIPGNSTSDLLKRIDKDVIDKHPDIVIIMVGTNDMLNSQKFISYDAYRQNLETIVKKLKLENMEIVLCSPPPADTVYLFERHKRKLFAEEPNMKLDSVASMMNSLSIMEQINYIDINSKFREMNLPVHNTDSYIRNIKNSNVKDGVHPTAVGYVLIAETIFNFLRDHKLIHPHKKILCFGDSITFGVGMEGEGTSDGTTYPAVLKRKLKEMFAGSDQR